MSCLKLSQDGDVIVTNNSIDRITNEQFVMSLRETWCSDYRETAFLKDIPRLIKRLQIQVKSCELHGPYLDDNKVDAILKSLEIIAQDIQMDSTQILMIREELSKNPLSDDGAIHYIFEQLGPDSPLIKILSLVNQGTILFGMHILKQDLCRNILTKDVRTPEGWRILIRLGDVVQVIHRRIEQSLDEFGNTTNHFEFEWEVLISFDRNLEQLRSASIRINRLKTADTMEEEKLELLRRTFIEGLIVL